MDDSELHAQDRFDRRERREARESRRTARRTMALARCRANECDTVWRNATYSGGPRVARYQRAALRFWRLTTGQPPFGHRPAFGRIARAVLAEGVGR